MDYSAFFEQVIFSIGEREFTVIHIISSVLAFTLIFILYRIVFKRLLPRYFEVSTMDSENHGKIKKRLRFFFYLLILLAFIWGFELDQTIYENKRISLFNYYCY